MNKYHILGCLDPADLAFPGYMVPLLKLYVGSFEHVEFRKTVYTAKILQATPMVYNGTTLSSLRWARFSFLHTGWSFLTQHVSEDCLPV